MMTQSEILKDKEITAEEFDTKFDNGENIDEYLDFSTAIKLKRLPNSFQKNHSEKALKPTP